MGGQSENVADVPLAPPLPPRLSECDGSDESDPRLLVNSEPRLPARDDPEETDRVLSERLMGE